MATLTKTLKLPFLRLNQAKAEEFARPERMNPPLLIHGSLHGVSAEVAAALRPFELAGGHVEVVQHNHTALVSYEGEGDASFAESLLRILEEATALSATAHGVFHFGFAHQEPASRYYGPARETHSLRSWLATGKTWLNRYS